ncbi:MAG: glycolate oxidase iron-sulfur subunit [Beggiatoa sp. IS2]|nr:MAG: glycolate oxidase iron-sulfur subunit [Beggiatoa sp. IS2]
MKTSLTTWSQQATFGQEANQILRSCVHCGFCTAVCPTYQLLGNELDGPRGRIYLIKAVLEGHPVSTETQKHLDQCLTCRACETACPSGVQYGRLVDIGRGILEQQVARSWVQKSLRWGLRNVLAQSPLFSRLLCVGQMARPLLPAKLREQIPPPVTLRRYPPVRHARKMLILEGCVQPALAPNINVATAHVLDKLGISLVRVPEAGCCGALDYHLGAHVQGLTRMRHLIETWWPFVENGVEAIVITASGCGSLLKEYGHLLRNDPHYAEKAARISALTFDLSEILAQENLTVFLPEPKVTKTRIAVHVPCSLQHGQKLAGVLETLLSRLSYDLLPVADSHLCCGSAGTYALLEKTISQQLLSNKLTALQAGQPECIVTANIGCQMHLQSQAHIPVKHWIELLAERC